MVKSPFFVIHDAVSPAKCELLISELGLAVPSRDENDKPIKNERLITHASQLDIVRSSVQENVAAIEERYDSIVKGMETPLFQQFYENPEQPCAHHGCESSKYMRKKWVKVKDVDLVGYLWLKDFNSGVPLDPRFEVYGGKLEFPAYDFSLTPQRGTLVLFPAGPHFITAISPVLIGSLEQVKVTVKMTNTEGGTWLYQPSHFPGSYQQWFAEDI